MIKLGYLPSLDGIRAVAVLIVFFSHIHYFGALAPGGFGVTIFFFLSGYIITTLMRVEYANSGTISLKNFYLRRVYRIFPPLYLTLLLVLILVYSGVVESQHTLAGLLSSFLHYTNYFVILGDRDVSQLLPGMRVTWSLAVEEHFYLLFPLLFIFCLKKVSMPKLALLLGVICLVTLAWRYKLYVADDFFPQRVYWATFARIDSILFGAILALSVNPALTKPMPISNAWALLILLSSSVVLILSLIPSSHLFREVFRYTIQGLALMPIFYFAVSKGNWWPFRILNTRFMVGFGKISYTFYLSHMLFILVFDSYFASQPGLSTVLAFAVSVLFSTVMYFAVEVRMSQLRTKLHRW